MLRFRTRRQTLRTRAVGRVGARAERQRLRCLRACFLRALRCSCSAMLVKDRSQSDPASQPGTGRSISGAGRSSRRRRGDDWAVPELTQNTPIQLNERVSLRPVIDALPSMSRGYLRHWVVHRVQKFVEVGSGRIGYAMAATALSDVSNGAKWNPDPSFNVADVILAYPEFASVLKVVLRDGHVMVPALKAKGK